MNAFVAALPMYDWPEARAETDRQWALLRDALRAAGLDAPQELARSNADLPPIGGGIRDGKGLVIAPDPASLSRETLDLAVLWRHPGLVFAQTCWGPMEFGLASFVEVVGQPDYSPFEGGEGGFYSSTVLMRREEDLAAVPPAGDGRAVLPVGRLRGRRFAYNGTDSMSGYLALERDLAALGERMTIFPETLETGGHRASIKAVAEGLADVCAIDCRSWDMAKRFEPAAEVLAPVGWTARRKGLPYIASAALPGGAIETVRAVIGTVEGRASA
ncbi:MAG: phosphate ABC transporter substrate-binding protein [Rhizobiales bacterium 65-79]|jgi:ABC-type phosphate/phosphonate transport system substrate-binding protein|nr:PhnD/SsuA/transferrin family substrate-binding protein [Hyphomicrobiales bacterium]OJT99948.1 MAG: phosphate ABC transporter substrate-binding protein [Rhizobiales bacterium 65-79]